VTKFSAREPLLKVSALDIVLNQKPKQRSGEWFWTFFILLFFEPVGTIF